MPARFPGTSPPHSAKSTRARPRAAATLASKEAPSSVAGMLLSGMSAQHVTPPAASAAVPVSQPSQSARPGSSMWTWPSTIPGSTSRPRASTSSPPARQLRTDRGDHAVLHRDVPRVAAHHQVGAHAAASMRSRMIPAISSIAVARSASASLPRRAS